ncbi:aminoacyl-histidine dipeptidase [Mariniblastus fucicola]|uniref:Cytosol non-specific dipeptidase n=1 Tax=Mariniblastus fucicola TaxID=980251 RepID=A0A5B9P1R4_9BACT|nr:aminoacyl-histidine dipeptidase [Mariniblastus fucicola]QEG20184.1 Cytosol non-specific dipeptidase [Mariniblastus fucicola]
MNDKVAQLAPAEVWTWFEKLNEVPRPSKQEERVIAFIQSVGAELGLETITDDAGNVIIRKPATAGKEGVTPVILQAHLDMVHQKNADTDFDFSSQGIESKIDGDWVKAKGTTLGADNGMGVASILAVLASDSIEHGSVEALFTIDEETGMTGAFELQPGLLQGKILLNTDTEDEGELTIGCAGGIDTSVTVRCTSQTPSAGTWLKVSITGLRGGHSGCEIHLGRGNANKIMNRILWTCQQAGADFEVASINGGSLRNAIPRESFAVLNVRDETTFKTTASTIVATIQAELSKTEPDLKVEFEATDAVERVLEASLQKNLLAGIYAAPCGVIRMSDQVDGLVETSTSLSLVGIDSEKASIEFLTRSSVESAKTDVTNQIEAAFAVASANVTHNGNYPGWEPNADSEMVALMKGIYEEMFGEQAIVNAVHAGLECGIIGSHYPGLDMVSFGPTIKNPHSPDEMCHIQSVEKYWQFLLEVLKRIE